MKKYDKIGEIFIILGTGLFIGGAACYVANQLTEEQVMAIAVLALIFIGIGTNLKNKELEVKI